MHHQQIQSSQSYQWAALTLAYVATVFVCGGASCARSRSAIPEFNPPLVFKDGTPKLEELIDQTNRSLAIKSLASNTLTIDSPELAYKLNGSFQWERPHNLRLETKLFSSALGTPLAVGSNSTQFWLQSQRPTPTIYYANYDAFENQQGPRHVLPVSPLWLREAFGVIELDPTARHEPPVARPDGKLQVVSYIPSPRGDYKRLLVVAPTTGTIEETHLYNHDGKLIASAQMSEHQYYTAINWSLPHKVKVQLQPDVGDPLEFEVEVGFYVVNEPTASETAFAFPDTTGLSAVDLIEANATMQRSYPVHHSSSTRSSNYGQQPASSSALPTAPVSLQPPVPIPGQPEVVIPPSQTSNPNSSPPLAPTPPMYRTASGNALGANWQSYLSR